MRANQFHAANQKPHTVTWSTESHVHGAPAVTASLLCSKDATACLPLARKASQKTGPRTEEGNLSRLRHARSARRATATKDGGPRRKLVRAAIAAQESAAGCKSRKGSLAARHVSATIRALCSPTIVLVQLAELGDDSGIRDGDVGRTVVGPGSKNKKR